jgi:hypothetical protein
VFAVLFAVLVAVCVWQGVGGLSVGSWQVYPCEVVLKGGWAPPGDADEARVPVLLKAYVSL